MSSTDFSFCAEVVDEVMEWIALRWTTSMIKRELRDWFPNLSGVACSFIISAAKKKIRVKYNVDPSEYKGRQIGFYEAVMRSRAKVRDKLSAAERIDKLLGLENVASENPQDIAEMIIKFKNEAKKTVGNSGDVRSENKGNGETNAEGRESADNKSLWSEKSKKEASEENTDEDVLDIDTIPKEVQDQIDNLRDDQKEGFRKKQNRKSI